ncbi:hypothetical protein [Salipaludibacillus aurantiacus]|uniref:hypothetical protein n=1 Tax=Salipaludibacillus aurantiacus TaxID=1601833 RepID=UPI0015A51427|nr:hypothetical protein [Salipaludibacillus aurantiacus]
MATGNLNFNINNYGIHSTARVSLQKFDASKEIEIGGISFTGGGELALGSLGWDLRIRKGARGFLGFGPVGVGFYFEIND